MGQEEVLLGRPPLNLTYDAYSQYCHDATWTFAYALSKTLHSKLAESKVTAFQSLVAS